MVAVESTFEIPEQDEVFLVSQRKYNLDPCRPWWEKLFFCVWLAFNRIAFKYGRIGAVAGIDAQGNIFMLEEEGIYWDEQTAKDSCQGPYWQVKPFPLNVGLPGETVQYKGHVYPQSIMPDRYRRRTFPVVPVGLQSIRDEAEGLADAVERIQNLTQRLKTTTTQ